MSDLKTPKQHKSHDLHHFAVALDALCTELPPREPILREKRWDTCKPDGRGRYLAEYGVSNRLSRREFARIARGSERDWSRGPVLIVHLRCEDDENEGERDGRRWL